MVILHTYVSVRNSRQILILFMVVGAKKCPSKSPHHLHCYLRQKMLRGNRGIPVPWEYLKKTHHSWQAERITRGFISLWSYQQDSGFARNKFVHVLEEAHFNALALGKVKPCKASADVSLSLAFTVASLECNALRWDIGSSSSGSFHCSLRKNSCGEGEPVLSGY